nr:retrovirus-related Pol polyprotein from transposon TNT 1-94 [Tanacetum cinerariifolium]
MSSVRTPQQNGVVKRRNRTLVEAVRTTLIFSRAPLFLWAEAIATACFTKHCSIIHHTTVQDSILPMLRQLSQRNNHLKDVDELNSNAMVDGNTFVNPFANSSISAAASSSSPNVDPSNMHTFYQPYPHEFQWTKDHPLEQVIEEPLRPVLTRNQLRSDLLVPVLDNISPLSFVGNYKISLSVVPVEHVAVQRETKARTLLLQSLPEDHMADFHHLDYAREIWLAVKARFGGNEESKKMRKTMLKQAFSEFSVSEEEGLHKGYDRFQKILSQLNQMQAKPDNDDVNIKFLRALPPSWSQVDLTLKTRGGLEYLSFDDLYNKLRSLEIDVKGGSSYGSRSTTVALTHSAFIGAASTNTKMVYYDQPSYSSSISYTPVPSGSIIEDVLHSFVVENEPTQQLAYEDFEQVDQLEMEELDIKWQMVMLALRINKECNVKKVDEKARYSAFKILEVKTEEPKAMVSVDSMLNWNEHDAKNKTEEAEQLYGLMAGFESDFAVPAGNASGGVNPAAVEFAMMGNSHKLLPKSDVKDPSLTNDLPSCSFKENVKPPRNLLGILPGRSIPAASRNRSASVHAGRSIPAASKNKPASIHAGKHIPAGRINKPAHFLDGSSILSGWTIPAARPFFGPTNLYFDNVYWPGIYNHMSMNEGRWGSAVKSSVHPHGNKDIGVIDSGCSRSMTGNKEKLDDFMQVKGGTVTFRGGEEAVSTACYVLNRVSITNPHNKTPYELLSGKVPNIRHLKPFRCQVTILNTSDHLGKFEGKANDGFLIGYAAHSNAYRVYNLSSKKVGEKLNLRYLEDKPNVQGMGQDLYFDLDYLTDSLGYTGFKTNPPAGTHDTNILAGTQVDDSESECDEHVILVPSFPSNSFSGPTVHDISAPMENNLDYAEELARLQRQEYEAHSATAKHGIEFSVDIAALLHQAAIDTRRNLVLAAGDPAGSIVSTGGVSAKSVAASGVFAGSLPTSIVSVGSVPASSVPAGGVLTGSVVSTKCGDPAASASVPVVLTNAPAATIPLPPAHSLGSCEHTTKFPSPFDLGNHQPTAGIFFSSSCDDDFCADVTNLASNIVVDPVATKRIAIGTKWILKNKRDARGIMVRNKARLVAQGHRQEEGINYDEVFALVARIEAIRLFLAFASYMGFMVYQMDVKSAFLYREIEEEVYVTQPKGFEDPHNPKHVYRVVKALYELHQAPRAWYARLSNFLLKHHYRRGTIDKTLFLKKDSRHIILIQVYVDDIIFGSMNKAWCDEFEVLMKGEFEMSDMESVRNATTPYEVPKHKSKDDSDDAVNVHLFRSMIGSLIYLIASRPDIMFAVSACSRHQVTPLTSHLNAVKKIFNYLKGKPNFGLWYPRDSPFQMEAYSDSDYAGGYPKLQVVQVLLLVVLVCADDLVPAGSCIIPTGSYSFMLMTWFLLLLIHADDLVPAGSCIIPTGSYLFMLMNLFLLVGVLLLLLVPRVGLVPTGSYVVPAAYVWYALTHRPTIVFDSLVKQFWATATVRTLEAGPSDIIATIDGNEVVVTESLIRTQLQLDDMNGLYEFTLHDVLDGMRAIGGWIQFPSSIASAIICMSTGRTYNFSRFIMDGMIRNIGSKRHKFLLYPRFLQMIFGIQTSDPSPRPTFDFTAKLFSNMKLNWDGPHMPFLASMLVVPAGGDGADAVAAGAAAAHDVSPPPIVPPIHSTPGPSSAPQVSPVKEPTLVRDHTPVRDPTPVREPTHSPVREPTPDSPRPPSPPPKTKEVGPTTSTRPPSPTRHTFVNEDISEGGGDFVSSPQVTTLENKLGITKKVLGGAVLKLVTRVKRLEGLLQQSKRRLVLSDSEGEDATPTEQDIDLAALHTLASASLGGDSSAPAAGPDADTTMPSRSTSTTRMGLRKPVTSSTSAHVSENIPAGASVPAIATIIPAGNFVDAAVHAAAAPSSSIPIAADKGKAPMVDDSLLADLLSEQERVLKFFYDSQLGEELAKKIHAEQEAEFARQQEELAQKAQAERVTSPTEHGPGMSDQRRRELDVAQLIYTEADWLELLAKIATNSAFFKQLLGDDVTEENMNEQLGMLLLRKRRELAEQSRVKPMTKTQQRDYMRDFVKNNSASVRSTFRPKPTLDAPSAKRANQGALQVPAASSQVPATPLFPANVLVHAATSSAPVDISVPAVSPAHAAASVPAETEVHTAESHLDAPLTASAHVSTEPTVDAPTPSSSCKRRKHIAKKRVTPIVDMADAAMIKFDNDSDSDDDPLPYAPYAGWEMVPSPLGSVHAYHNMARHTKHFTTLRELLHMVEKTDL